MLPGPKRVQEPGGQGRKHEPVPTGRPLFSPTDCSPGRPDGPRLSDEGKIFFFLRNYLISVLTNFIT